MPAEIVAMEDCASNYGIFNVPSSDGKGSYTVTFSGSEGMAHCSCKAYQYSPEHTCKHITWVWEHACMYNPQWHEATEDPEITPVGYNYQAFTGNTCKCGGPLVAVRRAI